MHRQRRPRLTRRDIDNIFDAMEFVLAGEFCLYEGEEDREQREDSFRRTAEKIRES